MNINKIGLACCLLGLITISVYYSGAKIAVFSEVFQRTSSVPNASDDLLQNKNTITIHNNGHIIRVKNKLHEDEKDLVVVVSTQGRSGSSWFSELLESIDDDTGFIFEPLILTNKVYKTRIADSTSVEIMSDVLNCQMKDDFRLLYLKWRRVLATFVRKCQGKCKTINDINNKCRELKRLVVKTIRLQLSETEDLLSKRSFQHMKVIYIVRDPRAQIYSRFRTFNGKNIKTAMECQMINADVWAFRKLSLVFPGHFYLLRYEDLCIDPKGEATRVWKFLQSDGNATLPSSVEKYLTTHATMTNKPRSDWKGNFGLYRDTAVEWYNWRNEISNNTPISIPDIERECRTSMELLGYLPLGSLETVKNLSVPFLGKINCDTLNCWSFIF